MFSEFRGHTFRYIKIRNDALLNKGKLFAILSITGPVVFVGIVLFLHSVQSQHDFMNQYMSELALGPYGYLMIIAFSCFAVSVFSISEIFKILGSPTILRSLLVAAAICLIGAGVINLDQNAMLHILFVMIASVLILLCMIMSPHYLAAFMDRLHRAVFWGLGTAAILISILNQYWIPDGIGQRCTAGCILLWLIWIGAEMIRFDDNMPNKSNSVAAKSRVAD